MKYLHFVIPTITLMSGHAFAECSVPDSLENMTFVNVINGPYSPKNPNAGSIVKVDYTADEYIDTFLNSDAVSFRGKYTYEVLDADQGVAMLRGDEVLPDKKPSHTILFKCLTDSYGIAVFTQNAGGIETVPRQNTVTYSILK